MHQIVTLRNLRNIFLNYRIIGQVKVIQQSQQSSSSHKLKIQVSHLFTFARNDILVYFTIIASSDNIFEGLIKFLHLHNPQINVTVKALKVSYMSSIYKTFQVRCNFFILPKFDFYIQSKRVCIFQESQFMDTLSWMLLAIK